MDKLQFLLRSVKIQECFIGCINKIPLALILVLLALKINAREVDMQFKHLDINSGLSSSQVKSVFKDSRGFVWIGTVNGLNRFDGYTTKVFRKATNDPESLPDNFISDIYEDHLGNLWIITSNGLTIFDPVTEKFNADHPVFHLNIEIPRTNIVNVLTDKQNNLWVFHRTNGVYKYDVSNDSVFHLKTGRELLPHQITDAKVDSHGNFWLLNRDLTIEVINPETFKVINQYTSILNQIPKSLNDYNFHLDADNHPWIFIVNDEKGVFHFNTQKKEVIHYSSNSKLFNLSHDNISCITSDQYGNVLIGTDHGGLNVINKKTGALTIFEYEQGEKNSLSQNSITAILRDNTNMIWIGTYKKGVNYYHPELFKFSTYTHNPTRSNWLSSDDVNSFAEDAKGNLWIGTNGSGLNYFDRSTKTFKTYRHQPGNKNSLSSDVIVDLCIDHTGGLWIGTYMGGLNYFDGHQFIHYQHNPNHPHSLSNNNVWAVYEDSDQQLWVGTLGGGISAFNRTNQSFTHFTPFTGSSTSTNNSNFIMAIAEDKHKNIWVATANGVDYYDKSTGRFIQFIHDEKSNNTLSSNAALDIYCDSRGWVWIATREGLNLYDPKKQQFTVLGEEVGILDNTVLTILESDDGNMWLATPQGLTNLIISRSEDGLLSFSTKNYDDKDGLHGKEFNEHAALKTGSGELVFGGADGFSIFDPVNLSNTLFDPKVVFTDLKIQNRRVEIGKVINKRVLLSKSLNYINTISLKYFEKTFSVGFSVINYLNPEKTVFHYKLDGFNESWALVSSNIREVTYTNLHPGDYTLRVFASDIENKKRSDEVQLSITVFPPFWKTKWAYSLYLVFILSLIFLIIQFVIRRERNKFLIIQERRETAKVHEMDMLKLKFFTNISHEFRTPLTLILSPLERIIKTTEDKTSRNQLKLVQRNALRLLSLVNQLLDFRRLEMQGLTLDVREGELVSFLRDAIESFSDLSESRNIKLNFSSNLKELKASFDYDKIEKIIFNLLSNAFKFTPENGSITVNLLYAAEDIDKKQVKIEVRDTGTGIPKEKQEMIFERFVQNIPEGVKVNMGSGIGLSLTREFVLMHEGTIKVDSITGVGSCFEVILPLKNNFKLQQAEQNIEIQKIEFQKEEQVSSEENDRRQGKMKPLKLMIVEDNPDIRFYLKDNFKADYEVIEVNSGDQAWEIIPEVMPDLIVSDIMMPGMDGLELCRTIKTDKRTSHIPVILLTARTADQHKFEGLENGADDYITKPFNFEMLALRIRKMIELRQTMRNQFQKNFEIQPSEISITSLDDKFLTKVKKYTEENMQEPDFSVEKLSSDVGISRAHLYNKLLALTGKSPIEYIRIMRIRRAAQLLEKSQLTVMEVAYKVGFNDPRYFTKHFKNEYNMTPTQYIKKFATPGDRSDI